MHWYPTLFGLRDTVPLTFPDEKVKNLLTSDNRFNLWILNNNKTVFVGSSPRPRIR